MVEFSVNRTAYRSPISTTVGLTVVAAAVLLSVAAAEWWGDSEQRALLALPADSRERIYHRSFDDMAALCGLPDMPEPLAVRCRDEATFLMRFPECQQECRALVAAYLPQPSR
ncbi:MAG TPA: hypothetical protein VN634_10835 [Candidatus Limnocylindrales bacterium]|nr:hypothetical protein [Candidatus Limnocylindrales bacterium]